jgi:hypothetical protein
MLRVISICAVFAALVAIPVRGAPIDITSRPESVFHAYVGKRVHLCGRYFGRDNTGAYVATTGGKVRLALYPLRRFPEGQEICVTGILHYWQKPTFVDACLANASSEFYFSVEDRSLRVVPKQR